MTWKLPRAADYVIYERNPLAIVICQLRFSPILMVEEAQELARVQEKIRPRFPEYAQERQVRLDFDQELNALPTPSHKRISVFRRPEDSSEVKLGIDSLAMTTTQHVSRQQFSEDFLHVLRAVEDVHGDVRPTRLGLRYINLIDAEQVGTDLQAEIGWEDLVSPAFLNPVGDLADLSGSSFMTEYRSPVGENGMLTLRSGLQTINGKSQFRIDLDRYISTAFELERVPDLLKQFSDDIYALFSQSIGNSLRTWMSQTLKIEG